MSAQQVANIANTHQEHLYDMLETELETTEIER